MRTPPVGPAPSAALFTQEKAPARQPPAAPPTGDDLAQALSGLAQDLLRDTQASRLARAQSQVEALHYAAQLAVARGDVAAVKALSAEALRVGRDLAGAGLPSEQVAPILEQARQIGGDAPPPDDTA